MKPKIILFILKCYDRCIIIDVLGCRGIIRIFGHYNAHTCTGIGNKSMRQHYKIA